LSGIATACPVEERCTVHDGSGAPEGITLPELLTSAAVPDAFGRADAPQRRSAAAPGDGGKDSGMKFYQRHVLPRLLHLAMRQALLLPFRQRAIAAAEGRVLEVGIGSGLNLPLYGPAVRSVIGLEPSPELLFMARDRAAAAPVRVALLQASAEMVPLDAASVDTVVTTWTLCTIPDAHRALAELRRVLKPGGALLFVEHGRAPEPGVARWQDRLDPLWQRVAGGCHLNRQIDALISGSGFRIEALTNTRLPGPRTHSFLYEGRARPT
jgi:SAM-dependent methyltransferase